MNEDAEDVLVDVAAVVVGVAFAVVDVVGAGLGVVDVVGAGAGLAEVVILGAAGVTLGVEVVAAAWVVVAGA